MSGRRAPSSRTEALSRAIEAAVRSREIPAGTKLGTKIDVQRRYGESTGVVNEAVRVLLARGVIESRPGPGGGLFAARPTPQVQLSHLILSLEDAAVSADAVDARDAIERAVTLDAARHRTPAHVAAMHEALAAMHGATADPGEYLRMNWALHRAIADGAKNRILGSLYLALLDIVERHIRSIRGDALFAATVEENLRVHAELVAAVVSGDPAEVERVCAVHASLVARPA